MRVKVRANLSKARNECFTFLGHEGTDYLTEYLNKRILEGEKITLDSPVLQLNPKGERRRGKERNDYLRTTLVARGIKKAITDAGFNWRPYVLRAYFSTALDIAENKGLISRAWRQFIMGHKGDIEARYSKNKRLAPDMIEEMRTSCQKCTKYLETRVSEVSEDNAKLFLQQQLLSAVGYKQVEIDRIDLTNVGNEDFQQLLRDKVAGAMSENGARKHHIHMASKPSNYDPFAGWTKEQNGRAQGIEDKKIQGWYLHAERHSLGSSNTPPMAWIFHWCVNLSSPLHPYMIHRLIFQYPECPVISIGDTRRTMQGHQRHRGSCIQEHSPDHRLSLERFIMSPLLSKNVRPNLSSHL